MRLICYRISFFFILGLLSYLLGSCTEDQRKRLEVTPTAYGNVDNIHLVCDEYLWTTVAGDTFRHHFEALYPVTPQPEPILDVRHIKGQDFNKVLKTHRAIIILADLSDKDDPATQLVANALGKNKIKRAKEDQRYRIAIHRDRWAKGQTIIYWFAPNRNALIQTIARDYQQVINILQKPDAEKLLEQVYTRGENTKVNKMLANDFGIKMRIPKDYEEAHKDSLVLWLHKETPKLSSNIIVYTINNPNPETLSADSLLAIRNRLTKDRISTILEDSYMQVDDKNLPVYYQDIQFRETKGLQARGIWYMVNDFMGGPFVTYLIPDPINDRIIMLDGFVHAPGQKKRPEMRKLDRIFSTLTLNADI